MNKKRKNAHALSICTAVLTILLLWIFWGNATPTVTEHLISSDEIPQSFSGFRIAQISDLHNKDFGNNNRKLLSLLESTQPDIIVLTGDFVDSYHPNMEISLDFAKRAVAIAPTYYVNGNHEARLTDYGIIKDRLTDAGVVVLENKITSIERSGSFITLAGINDPIFRTPNSKGSSTPRKALASLELKQDNYTILLSHRPEIFDLYVQAGVDLALTGHTHGGQFRVPFVGGILVPGQGFFPKYDAGLFTEGSTTMIISRGLGDSVVPIRINNRPEIVVVELHSEQK